MKSDIDFEKDRLRKIFKEKRKNHDRSAENKIAEKLFATEEYKAAENLLLYASLPDEINTDPIFLRALSDGKKVYYPKTEKGGKMEFFRAESLESLSVGKFGIREPETAEKFFENGKTLCVVPGFSFDKEGFRLGYGGGYYDRFLSSLTDFRQGFAFQLFFRKNCRGTVLILR